MYLCYGILDTLLNCHALKSIALLHVLINRCSNEFSDQTNLYKYVDVYCERVSVSVSVCCAVHRVDHFVGKRTHQVNISENPRMKLRSRETNTAYR